MWSKLAKIDEKTLIRVRYEEQRQRYIELVVAAGVRMERAREHIRKGNLGIAGVYVRDAWTFAKKVPASAYPDLRALAEKHAGDAELALEKAHERIRNKQLFTGV
jgi:hypothetical protein